MKKAILFILVMVFGLGILTAQNNQVKKNPAGSWKFEAPYAPEGYTSGTIILDQAGQKYSAQMSFTGSEYRLTGEKVTAVSDSILFSVSLEGEIVKVMLKINDASKMSGKAVYSAGEVPLSLTRNSGSDMR